MLKTGTLASTRVGLLRKTGTLVCTRDDRVITSFRSISCRSVTAGPAKRHLLKLLWLALLVEA